VLLLEPHAAAPPSNNDTAVAEISGDHILVVHSHAAPLTNRDHRKTPASPPRTMEATRKN
jgi:hypothetical protein